MEKLAPARPGTGPLTLETQANPEYPFFYLEPGPPGTPETAHLVGPSEFFGESESRSHYGTALELLTTYQTLYTPVGAWGIPIAEPV